MTYIDLNTLQSKIDTSLQKSIDDIMSSCPQDFKGIFRYQLGWEGEKSGKDAQGKRLRPLIVLLSCHAFGGSWRKALPAAVGVELMHNFSLIHDDIQDNSETRRGRKTVWTLWGKAQAINVGDAMLATSLLALYDLQNDFQPDVVNQAVQMLQSACFELTHGQFLDIAFENEKEITEELYWKMITGKTSSLLSACFGLGALLGGADPNNIKIIQEFGKKLGQAFQVQDDWLGIWGDDVNTGKSNLSDLITRKKTYPILLGIQNRDRFFNLWNQNSTITEKTAKELAVILSAEKVDQLTKQKFQQLYQESATLFGSIHWDEELSIPLRKVSDSLLSRLK